MQDRQFSIITPLHKKGYESLERFMLHLKEQDYQNFEVVFVLNSPDGEAHDFVMAHDGWKYRLVDAGYDADLGNGNHCRAFNKGAEAATGDYLLFLDPDVYLYPGILREYKDAFDKHPEAGFVYGDYDLEGAGRVQGRSYDEYQLRCANYVSGAFPIRSEAFRGWNEAIQSLQDWDMWLSAVEGGAKGHYIARPCFVTDPPSQGGISMNSAANWQERYTEIRSLHETPLGDTVVTSLGAPFHATVMAKILGVDVRVMNNLPNFKPHQYRNILLLGFYPTGWEGHMKLFYELGDIQSNLAYEKRIIHWIGTDIYQMQHMLSWMALQNIRGMLTDPEFGFIHLTECTATQLELAELGISSQVIPLPASTIYDTCPLPDEFTVGVYINPTQDMYFEEFMYDVADAMPDVKFKFFGNHGLVKTEANKEWVGWVNMAEFLPTISAIVRLTKHDGLPVSPIEAMMMGRNALTSQPLDHAMSATYIGGQPDKADIVNRIYELKELPLNVTGSAYWRKECSPSTYRDRMAAVLA